jgi:hypothetical protein
VLRPLLILSLLSPLALAAGDVVAPEVLSRVEALVPAEVAAPTQDHVLLEFTVTAEGRAADVIVIDTLAPALGMKVSERPMKMDEVLAADEVFLTGTAAEVIGVGSIDGRKIGSGVVGPLTKRLEAEFKRIVAKDAPED